MMRRNRQAAAIMIAILIGLLVLAIVFGPQLWIRAVLKRHAAERADFPGTGGELARHLLDEAGLGAVTVEPTAEGDHYDPDAKAVRLLPGHHDGRSLAAVAIAAHEVGHALQDAAGYRLLATRSRLARLGPKIEVAGAVVMMVAPLAAALLRSPGFFAMEFAAGLAVLSLTVVIHLVTLPVEFDASFGRALPILREGRYLAERDLPAARQILRAAALTYVAAALASLLNVARWIRVIRF
jgi:Zn-dependent membrane protease YugP